jgi:SAM-dependent methyltransferase
MKPNSERDWALALYHRSVLKQAKFQHIAGLLGDTHDARCLDVGGDNGVISLLLRKRGGDWTSADLEPGTVDAIRRLVGGDVHQIGDGPMPFGESSFDLVVIVDFLEHITDDAGYVQEMTRVLRPGGTLIVNVAALSVLRGRHSVFGAELRRSTRRRLRGVLARGGFDVVRLTYTNFVLFPLMLAVRTTERAMGLASPEEAGGNIAVPFSLLNEGLSALLRLEALALRVTDMPIGSSLLCVARRPPAR